MQDTTAAIEHAFRNVEKPTAETAIAPRPCANCEQLGRDLLPYTWETLPPELIERNFDALPVLRAQALRDYLPT